MKKLFFLAAFALLAGTIVSCDNTGDEDVQQHAYATDDGLLPIKPPTPPVNPPPPVKGY